MDTTEILTLCYKCKEYRELEKFHLNFKFEYSISADEIQLLEDNDVDVDKYITNQKEYDQHENTCTEKMDKHLRNCNSEGCKLLFEYRVNCGVYKK